MSTKILDLGLPPIRGYLHHAYYLSVAQQHPSFKQWFATNYIQLKYYPEMNYLNFARLDLYDGKIDYCPLLDFQMLKIEIVKINDLDIVDFAVNCIEQGYYMQLYIDEYYAPVRQVYNSTHFLHENLLYGYDYNSSSFYLAGFDQERVYSFDKIEFFNLIEGFDSAENHLPIKLFKVNKNTTYKFDIENMKNMLRDYLYSKNTSKRNRMFNNPTTECVYGVNTYKYLKQYFKNLMGSDSSPDIRILYIFWEHKKCMTLRIKYLYENNYFSDIDLITAYESIENKALIMKNQQLKYMVKGDKSDISEILNLLDELYTEEIKILTKLLELISE